ncbi:unnamed protein product [Rhizoctonia solani]|uniref:Uncharacterized protein n=1 Tax=Rhizoctonia solani TaxID=456999 RepID=A0A8H3CLY2_9AGAM
MDAHLDIGDLTVTCGNGLQAPADNVRRALPCNADSDARLPANTAQCWLPALPGERLCIHFAWNGAARRGHKTGAGIFCVIYIAGVVVERAFSPLNKGDLIKPNGDVAVGAGPIEREWEVRGKFYRGPNGVPYERPFYFTGSDVGTWAAMQVNFLMSVSSLGSNSIRSPYTGTVRVVLHWARPNPSLQDPYPMPTQELADETAEMLHLSGGTPSTGSTVSLGPAVLSEVLENNMKVERVEEDEYTFMFHYAHPGWLLEQGLMGAVVSSGEPAM